MTNQPNLTAEQVTMLSKVERDMDAGIQSYVVCGGRWAFPSDLLNECGIVSGQTVTSNIITFLQKGMIARLETELLEKAWDGAP